MSTSKRTRSTTPKTKPTTPTPAPAEVFVVRAADMKAVNDTASKLYERLADVGDERRRPDVVVGAGGDVQTAKRNR